MSIVSGVVLCASIVENDHEDGDLDDQWVLVNAWLAERGFGTLVLVEEHAGGSKHPQMRIGCAGFNLFQGQEDEFAQYVLSLSWMYPDNVVLVIQPEEGPTRVWRIGPN